MKTKDRCPGGDRIIRLPLLQVEYIRFTTDRFFAKKEIERQYREHPELFPADFDCGYVLNGLTPVSAKQGYRLRKIRVNNREKNIFTIAPTFLMPYMTALTELVEKSLFPRRFNVPYRGLTYVFGRNNMFRYRQEQAVGRFNIIGTTVKSPENIPRDLLADEKHTSRRGKKQYIAMTVAKECILGAELTESASEVSLKKAYGAFADEVRSLNPDYAPESVNTDGWLPAQSVWKKLFPSTAIIPCFLHAFIRIRSRATKVLKDSFTLASEKVWSAYRAENKASFAQRLRRLKEWAAEQVPDSPMKDHIMELCANRHRFINSYGNYSAILQAS